MTEQQDPVVRVEGLRRIFGSVVAIDGLDLVVNRGEIFAVLGHNGAGKTTLMRVLNGLLRPTDGHVEIFGQVPYEHGASVRARVGVVTESTALDDFLSVRESLHAYGTLFGVPPAPLKQRTDALLEEFGLTEVADKQARELSAGMRQRAAFARALVHEPELLLLDEPTANMDPVAAHRVRGLVADAARRAGRTVMISTHNLAEAQEMCDRLVVLRQGRMLVTGTLEELSRQLASEVHTRIAVPRDAHDAAIEVLTRFGSVMMNGDGRSLEVSNHDAGEVPQIVAALVHAGVPVEQVFTPSPTLEDVYLHLHQPPPPEPEMAP